MRVFDESVWEKPESIKREDLGEVAWKLCPPLDPCEARRTQLAWGDPGRSATKGRRAVPGSDAALGAIEDRKQNASANWKRD